MSDVVVDYIHNGQAHGETAVHLLNSGFTHHALRPWIGKDGRSYRAVVRNGQKPVSVPLQNATATLRKDEWKIFDDAIVPAAKERLRATQDLIDRGLRFNIPDGMGKTVLETETMGQVTDADINMDGLNATRGDRPQFELTNLPLPIISKGFSFSARQLATSRERGNPLDTTMAEESARRVAEKAEKLLTGLETSYGYGGGTIYGYINHPSRKTKTNITAPTASGWSGETLLNEVLAMRQLAKDDYHFGPYGLYVSTAWDQYMDRVFKSSAGDLSGRSVRQHIADIDGIEFVRTLDFLSSSSSAFVLVLVQLTSNVVRLVTGMPITTVQWPSEGGLQLNFKVMTIMVPQLRDDINDNMGLVHGTTA